MEEGDSGVRALYKRKGAESEPIDVPLEGEVN